MYQSLTSPVAPVVKQTHRMTNGDDLGLGVNVSDVVMFCELDSTPMLKNKYTKLKREIKIWKGIKKQTERASNRRNRKT